jgi:phospholipase C
MRQRYHTLSLCCLLAVHCFADATSKQRPAPTKVEYSAAQTTGAQKIKHVIIIYQENWSFDTLYGKFPGVNGLTNADPASVQQVDKQGVVLPLLPACIDTRSQTKYSQIPSSLLNAPFDLQPYIPMSKTTGDLVHEFYQEIAQIGDGTMNAFAAWSDAGGFVMSYYDIASTRIGKIAQEYTLCDNFFHSCYGGSMANVMWLFAAQMPVWPKAPQTLVAKVLPDGTLVKDGTVSPDGYAVNDAQPFYAPFESGTSAKKRVPPQTYATIGDRLSEKGVSWGWYAEGWEDALKGKPSPAFPFHHQAPSYFTQFAPGTEARKLHLFDLSKFYQQLDQGTLPAVCFIRSLGFNSEHPSDGPLLPGLDWAADLVERIQESSAWKDCAIILTYDENGGRWDHVTPPLVDQFGLATRIPALIISPFSKKNFVDHTCYETVSILKFIEERWGLAPLSTRDAQANNLLNAFDFPTK